MATKLRRRKDEVRLTVEDEVEEGREELQMSHQEIAVWIDCQARWPFLPTSFASQYDALDNLC